MSEPDWVYGLKRTFDKADEQAQKIFADALGLDEFQRIAVADLLKDMPDLSSGVMPAPGSEEEKTLMELGAIVSEAIWGRRL